MPDIFAKLETVNGYQTLAELVNTEDGLKVRLRRDRNVTCEISLGPWPDTDDGWDKAEAALAKVDMTAVTKALDNTIDKLFENSR